LISNDIYTLGMKLILCFGAPVAHEQAPANALRFALDLKRQVEEMDLRLNHRIGINSGYVFCGDVGPPYRRQYTMMGDAVNLAARLMSASSPNHILISKQIANEAGTSFAVEDLRPIKVKGKKDSIPVCTLEGECTVSHEPAAELGALFGREAELKLLQQVSREAEGRNGRAIIISGAAGIGKSRLTQEFLKHLRVHNWAVLVGACYSYTTATPYVSWIQILKSFFNINSEDDKKDRTRKVVDVIKKLKPKPQGDSDSVRYWLQQTRSPVTNSKTHFPGRRSQVKKSVIYLLEQAILNRISFPMH